MARTVRNPNLDSRDARLRLSEGAKHWGRCGEIGLHIGYRRGPRGGTWYARRMAEGRYSLTTLGAADDLTDADGTVVLTYRHALEAARAWWKAETRRALGVGDHQAGPYTVAQACDDYMLHFIGEGKKSEYATRRVIEVHIRPAFGAKDAAKLTPTQITQWKNALAAAPKMLRTKRAAKGRATRAIDPTDPDAMRARRASANRVLTVLKAILNHAWAANALASDAGWRRVKPFRDVSAPVIRYLSADECRRLVNTCDTGLRKLVRGAVLTGARFGELRRLRAADVNLDAGKVAIRQSKNGEPRHITLTDEGRAVFAEMVAGLRGDALVFLRDDGNQWEPAQQTRPLREACERAGIFPAIGFHILRHTHASALAMAGTPMGVIALQLGHKGTRTTEKHYAHLNDDFVSGSIRANFPQMGLGVENQIVPLRRGSTR